MAAVDPPEPVCFLYVRPERSKKALAWLGLACCEKHCGWMAERLTGGTSSYLLRFFAQVLGEISVTGGF